MAHTLVEKILLAHCDADDVRPGDVVTVRCDVVMANDVSGPVAFRAMEKMGAERVFDPSRVVMVADHFMPAKDARSAELQARLKRWSEEQGVTYYGQGRGGIEHTLLCEEGWIVPGRGDRRRRLPHLHLRRARRVRDGARLDRHRVVPRARLVLAGGARDDPDRAQRAARELRHGQGRDPRRARADRRRRRDERGARVRRPGRGGALGRRAPRRREHGGRGGLGDGHLPGRRGGRGVPRRPRPLELDGGALRPGRDVPAAPRDRPVGARAARRAAAPAGQREPVSRGRPASPSTRSTSATARTGR